MRHRGKKIRVNLVNLKTLQCKQSKVKEEREILKTINRTSVSDKVTLRSFICIFLF